jgi:DNA invertase Pin-like site-specific DNA recombinase
VEGVYTDRGISGAETRRPALDQLLEKARARRIDTILVWRFDRFARSTRHLIESLEEFRTLGVGFVSLSELIDTSTPAGEALFTVAAAFAKFERDILRERVLLGLDRARAQGKHIGRPRLHLDSDLVRQLARQGLSSNQIARRVWVWERDGRKHRPSRSTVLRALRAGRARRS